MQPGSTTTAFSASAVSAASDPIVVSAAYNAVTKSAQLKVTEPKNSANRALAGIACTPSVLRTGDDGTCSIRLIADQIFDGTKVRLAASSAAIKVPAEVVARAGQSMLEFQVGGDAAAADPVVVTAQLGAETVTDTITVSSGGATQLRVPSDQFVKYGSELRFRVSSADPSANLSAGKLPPGAAFDPDTGEFRWIPDAGPGAYHVSFRAIAASGAKARELR
jgi:hypothetical protein